MRFYKFFPLYLILLSIGYQSCTQKKVHPKPNVQSPSSATNTQAQDNNTATTHSSGLPTQTLNGITIKPINYPGQNFMILRNKKTPFQEIQPFFVKSMGTLFTACQAYGLEFDGMPSCLFYEFNEEKGYTDMAASIAVKQTKEVGQGIEALRIPPTDKALQVDFYGDYKKIANVHYSMEDYMNSHKIKPSEEYPLIEEYVTEPRTEPDPNKRLTRITYFY